MVLVGSKVAKLRPANEEEAHKVVEFRATDAYQDALQQFDHSVLARRSKVDDRLVLRFVRAGYGNVDKAVEMFVNMLTWRDEYSADLAFEWTFEERSAVKDVYPFGFHKFDKIGRPIYIERVGRIDVKKLLDLVSVDRMLKFHVQMLEWGRTSLWKRATDALQSDEFIDQQLSIVDLSGLGRQHLSRSVYAFIDAMSRVDQNYYPEILSKMLIINAPWVFSVAWKIIRPWLHERTKNKIEVVSGDPTPMLLELIDEDVLPDFLGGKDTTFLQSELEKELEEVALGRMPKDARAEREHFGLGQPQAVAHLKRRSSSNSADSAVKG